MRKSPDITDALLKYLPKEGKIADVGCGDGSLLDCAREKTAAELFGIDPDIASDSAPDSKPGEKEPDGRAIRMLHSRAEDLPFGDGTMDALILQCVFSLCDPADTPKELHRVLKKDGLLLLSDLYAGETGSDTAEDFEEDRCGTAGAAKEGGCGTAGDAKEDRWGTAGDATEDGEDITAGSGMVGRIETRETIENRLSPYFTCIHFEDHSEALVKMAVDAVLYGNCCADPQEMKKLREKKSGYGLWVFRKREEEPGCAGRDIYLIRHGAPQSENGDKKCLGGRGEKKMTDPPLSGKGIRQAELLAAWLREQIGPEKACAVFSSPLRRCAETAEPIAKALGIPVRCHDGLREIDTGLWNGLTFKEIKERFPEEYRRRGENLWEYPVPGGESFRAAGERFADTVREICRALDKEGKDGPLIIVAHAGVNRAFLKITADRERKDGCCLELPDALFTGEITETPQPRGGISILSSGKITACGWKPEVFLDETEIRDMYRHFETPEPVIFHMKKVAAVVLEILARLHFPPEYSVERLEKAALVHDIARTRKKHADAAAKYLVKKGFPAIAELVRLHQSPEPTDLQQLTEADILFYADKRVLGDRVVTVNERFEASYAKCRTPEAAANHAAMREKAEQIESKIRNMMDVI